MLKSLFDFPAWYYDLIRIFSARIVLEVFGGGGAVSFLNYNDQF
jgi:hypothetical protein